LPWQHSAIHSYDEKETPGVLPIFTENFRGLKPKGETNRSFLVHHPSSDENTVDIVGSHLKKLLNVWICFEITLFKKITKYGFSTHPGLPRLSQTSLPPPPTPTPTTTSQNKIHEDFSFPLSVLF